MDARDRRFIIDLTALTDNTDNHTESLHLEALMSKKLEAGVELAARMFAGLEGSTPPLPENFSTFTFEHLFGDVWQGPELELQERSLVTCTVLVALARESEQLLHFRAARNLGIPRSKLEAMITHVAHYAGWPVAVSAFRTLDKVWTEMDAQAASTTPADD